MPTCHTKIKGPDGQSVECGHMQVSHVGRCAAPGCTCPVFTPSAGPFDVITKPITGPVRRKGAHRPGGGLL